jgi:A/G-specific adenine glycosylase
MRMRCSVRDALLRFYDQHARDLPWRRTRDPYAIWVSEIMLQQTRVDTVLRYYDRFLARFPTTTALAGATEDDVLSAWSGLGYYRRARLLHTGVREVVAHYGGQVPEDPAARLELPGIGRYTAGAIGSIAFDRAEPIVDGNVARVLCRLHAIDTPLGRADTDALLWEHAAALAYGPRPGALNQALMELGATLCSKSSPSCERCPLRTHCQAHAQGRAQDLPVARKKAPPRAVHWVVVAALSASSDAVVLARGQSTLFGGLWNLPMSEGHDADDAKRALHDLGISARLTRQPRTKLEHVLSHRHLHVTLYTARLSNLPKTPTLRLLPVAELAQVGVSSLTSKALAHVFPGDIAPARRT